MNILQVNYTDLPGYRFNGGALNDYLRSQGHSANMAVEVKLKDDTNSFVFPFPRLTAMTRRLESLLSLQSILHFNSFLFYFSKAFKKADLVHYHVIHTGFFSYLALPLLTSSKSSVWSIHDPWALTGHCIHPFACSEWKTGCTPCPHLDYPFPLALDLAGLQFKLKKYIYARTNIHLVVASPWMKKMVESSPLLQHLPLHYIPFGINLNVYTHNLDKRKAKQKLGLDPDRIVLGFRSLNSEFKGMECLIQAFKALPNSLPITILTCNTAGLLKQIHGKFPIIELGELWEEDLMADFFQALDVHLMPSLAEAFGMMAMEAAACGIPSIVFEKTALPQTCFAPEAGLAVEYGNAQALARAMEVLVSNPEKRLSMGQKARELAVKHYDFTNYAQNMLKLYDQVLAERTSA